MLRTLLLVILSGGMLLPLAGCEPSAESPRVVATVGMVADIVREVAGDRMTVEGLIGEGVDPHLYQPSRGDVVRLTGADLVFYNGLMLEGKLADVLARVGARGKPVQAVTDGIDPGELLAGDGGHHDPHVWMDVSKWMHAVRTVAGALATSDPPNADGYAANAEAYLEELRRLDDYAREVLATIPEQQRVLVTAHDAFGYLGRAYGIEVRGIQGISTESEAGVRDINDLVSYLVERRIAAVFVETSVADKNVRAIIEGAADRGHTVRIGGELYSDAMGPAGTYEGTYVGMIDHNVTTIARALGGTAPAGGMQGRLVVEPDHDR